MVLITPIEFAQQNYRQQIKDGKVVVWHKESLIEYVEAGDDRYKLCADDPFSDSDLVAYARPYEMCLQVESIDPVKWRQECHALIGQLPDDRILGILADLKQDKAFWESTL